VHVGFKEAFEHVWGKAITNILIQLKLPCFFTGHSLGAALATLAAGRCLQDPTLANCRPAALYTFGSPRVGDRDFGATLGDVFHCRVVNDQDIVPTVPPDSPLLGMTFQHTGQMHKIESDGLLHVFPPNVDASEGLNPVVGTLDLIRQLRRLLDGARASLLEPPLPLRDHTPVNYTARLERASLAEAPVT
jgi:hypothetical protein